MKRPRRTRSSKAATHRTIKPFCRNLPRPLPQLPPAVADDRTPTVRAGTTVTVAPTVLARYFLAVGKPTNDSAAAPSPQRT